MIKIKSILPILFLLILSSIVFAQTKPPVGWKRIRACQTTFYAPKTMKDLKSKREDSCTAEFEDRNLNLSITYGNYGESFTKADSMTEFTEGSTKIDGKKAQSVTYIYTFKDNNKKMSREYVAGLFVSVVSSAAGDSTITSLVMTAHGKTKKDLDTAERIFKTVRFK